MPRDKAAFVSICPLPTPTIVEFQIKDVSYYEFPASRFTDVLPEPLDVA